MLELDWVEHLSASSTVGKDSFVVVAFAEAIVLGLGPRNDFAVVAAVLERMRCLVRIVAVVVVRSLQILHL